MKHTVTIEPSTHLGWELEYIPQRDAPFTATHPDKGRSSIHAASLDGLLHAIAKREAGLCRLTAPIPVAYRGYRGGRIDAEIFAYDDQLIYLRTSKGEVETEFFQNLRSAQNVGSGISLRLRDENYPALLAEAVKADAAAAKASQRQLRAKEAFTEVTAAAIKSAPFTKDTSAEADDGKDAP